jgi:hypothetical protein
MANFPSEFVKQTVILEPGIGERGDTSLRRLREKGYSIGLGLSEYKASRATSYKFWCRARMLYTHPRKA